ncbi:alpha-mannosidase [Gracilibacillus orientalis]|uniref:Alpha-mannosidase n=1 Tax=Gracilibacillus orientalis TaxID=334253 RepID=A0A1I4HUW4_9BACI|nr:alpha-mannosidase [Gracilibacillus orientalis]SFL45610.1 alpha-mannosidase [Gracilibacillus orientalis]
MFWTVEKLDKQVSELQPYRYRNIKAITSFNCLLDEEGKVGERPPANTNDWQTININDKWEGRDKYLWLKTDITIPKTWKDAKIIGVFDFGKTGGGHNSGFESLLYVNDQPYQGVDSNHQEVFFNPQLAGDDVTLCFRLWSGLEGGGQPTIQEHQLKTAFLACLDPRLDDLYFTSKATIETVKYLEQNQPERVELLKALDMSFREIDWSSNNENDFYQSTYLALSVLKDRLEQIPNHYPVTVNAIGHTHIDVAWLWRLKHTREKVARSFSTVLRLMEQYPDYIFLQTQPQLYEYIKHDYPDIYQQMKTRIKEGRWEPEGGMWLEADCNLTSGESLVRQLLHGTRFFKEEFGKDCEYLWLPDVFGYSWALPQILKKSGIHTFMTTKISWSQYNKMPHDTFKWRGIDGTEILTHFITTPEDDRWFYTYNGKINPKSVKGIWEAYRDKDVNNELILSYGYGDGGGGVNREMLEMIDRLDKMPGLPNIKTGRADDYFRKLHETVENTDQYVHTWDGELYLEYHRGTYTSQAYNKRMNRKMELLLREAEWINVFHSVINQDWEQYPQAKLNDSWKIVLRNQFHDIIPGSSIREVYEDSYQEYNEAYQLAQEAHDQASTRLVDNQLDFYTVTNSASFMRTDLVEITNQEDELQWYDYQGEKLESQKTKDGNWMVKVNDVPALGSKSIYAKREKDVSSAVFSYTSDKLSTPLLEIAWNENGQLTKIFDKKAKRDVLPSQAKANIFQVFEDKPMLFDAWDIDIYYQQKMKEIQKLISVELIEDGPIRSIVQFQWEYANSTIKQNMVVYSENPRIDFETYIDWHEREQLLKAAFPVDVRSTEATYDIQYGNVTRPTHWNTSWDLARFETVGHQWADLSETGYGVSLLNDSKYGYDIKDNIMRLTLLKSSTDPDVKQDQGEHYFQYAIYPHQGDWRNAKTVQQAWNLNNPLVAVEGKMDNKSLFSMDTDHVMIDAVKKAEDDNKIIVRLHEFTGARETIHINSDFPIHSWQECNLLEEPISEKVKDEPLYFTIHPYEIKAFIIELKS